MSWRDRIKADNTQGTSWRDRIQPDPDQDEFQQKLARQREKDKELYERTKESPLLSGVRSASDTLSFGYDDELAAGLGAVGSKLTGDERPLGDIYSADQAALEAVKERAAKDNPGSTIVGQIGAALLTAKPSAALAGKIGSGAAKLGAGANSAKALGLAGAAAAEGGLYGSGTAGQGERLSGAATGATTGAAVSGAMSGLGAGARALGRATPGVTPNSLSNKVVATLSPRRLMQGVTKDDLLEYLNNPELRKKMAETDFTDEMMSLSKDLGRKLSAVDKAVSKNYGNLLDEGTKQVVEGADALDPLLKTLKGNRGVYSPKVVNKVKIADKMANGLVEKTADMDQGQALLAARKHLDEINYDGLDQGDKEIIKSARDRLNSYIHKADPLKQADTQYSQFKTVKDDLENLVFKGRGAKRAIDADKLRLALTTTKTKGSAFNEAMNTYNDFIKSNPKLMQSKDIQEGVDAMNRLKELVDIGQLEYKLSRSGGPSAEAIFTLMQGGIISKAGEVGSLALPFLNPTVWAKAVDAMTSPEAKKAMEKIQKASEVIKSASIREIARQRIEKDKKD